MRTLLYLFIAAALIFPACQNLSPGDDLMCSVDDVKPCIDAVQGLDSLSDEDKNILLVRIKNGIQGKMQLEGYTLRDLFVDGTIQNNQFVAAMDREEPLNCRTEASFQNRGDQNSISIITYYEIPEEGTSGFSSARHNIDFHDLTGTYLFTERVDHDVSVFTRNSVARMVPVSQIREAMFENVPEGLFDWTDEKLMEMVIVSGRLTVVKTAGN